MKISALHIANLFDYGLYHGVSESSLRSYLSKHDLDVCNPQNSVSELEFLAVFKALIFHSDNPHFGLNYGCYLNIKALSFISEISLNASSIEQATLILQEYLNVSFPLVSISTKEEGAYYVLQLNCKLEDETIRNHLLDIAYCFIFRELRLMLSEEFTPKLQLPYANISPYSIQLNSKIENGPKHQILLDKNILKTEINKKKVKEIEYLLPKFMLMLDKKNKDYRAFSLQVRHMTLNMCSPEIPTFKQVSKQFPLSDRTIQRKLTKEGLSFRRISDDIKRELSFYLMKGRQIKTQDIAYMLGYSESSAYLHAVKRWGDNAP
ncbi:MAG: hypothetical protein COA58_14970 [Bacteroidetes bacterium]|nr:MAG: hypothetical protein COA58_14970 [Bacteroidota bacterium]